MTTITLDKRQQNFQGETSDFQNFDYTGEILPDVFAVLTFEGNDYETYTEEDIFYQDNFSIVNAYRFGNGFLGPISPASFNVVGFDTQSASSTDSIQYAQSYSIVPTSVFGHETIHYGLRTVENTVGTVVDTYYNFVNNSVTVLGLEISFVTNKVKVIREKTRADLDNSVAEFGTDVNAFAQSSVVVRSPSYAYVSNTVKFEEFTVQDFAGSTLAPIEHIEYGFVNNKVGVVTSKFSTVENSVIVGYTGKSFTTNKLAPVARQNTQYVSNSVQAGIQVESFVSNKVNAFGGRESYVAQTVPVARIRTKTLLNKVILGKSRRSFARNSVNIGLSSVDFLQNRVIITTEPYRAYVKNRVNVIRPNSVQFLDLHFDEGILLDPLYNEYIYGF